MINVATLAKDASEKLNCIAELEQSKNYAADLEATYNELQKVKESMQRVHDYYQIYKDRLPLQDIQKMDLPKLGKEIQRLQNLFIVDHQRRQVQELRTVLGQLIKIQSKIADLWKSDAQKHLQSYLDLHDMVHSLPEIRSRETTLNEQRRRLISATMTIPPSQRALADFDQDFSQYRQSLSTPENLSANVRVFLQKVQQGTATMADVTIEILDWCNQGGYNKVFQIRFIS